MGGGNISKNVLHLEGAFVRIQITTLLVEHHCVFQFVQLSQRTALGDHLITLVIADSEGMIIRVEFVTVRTFCLYGIGERHLNNDSIRLTPVEIIPECTDNIQIDISVGQNLCRFLTQRIGNGLISVCSFRNLHIQIIIVRPVEQGISVFIRVYCLLLFGGTPGLCYCTYKYHSFGQGIRDYDRLVVAFRNIQSQTPPNCFVSFQFVQIVIIYVCIIGMHTKTVVGGNTVF